MKNQIHPSSRSEARQGNARFIIHHRDGAWPGLLLAACCAVLTGLAWPTRAAVSEAWVQRNTNNVASNSQEVKVVFDAAGDIIVAGSAVAGVNGTDTLTTKCSGANGSVLWQGGTNSYAAARALAVDSSGNVLVTGISNNGYYTAKYAAADGALLWERRYIGSANNHEGKRSERRFRIWAARAFCSGLPNH